MRHSPADRLSPDQVNTFPTGCEKGGLDPVIAVRKRTIELMRPSSHHPMATIEVLPTLPFPIPLPHEPQFFDAAYSDGHVDPLNTRLFTTSHIETGNPFGGHAALARLPLCV